MTCQQWSLQFFLILNSEVVGPTRERKGSGVAKNMLLHCHVHQLLPAIVLSIAVREVVLQGGRDEERLGVDRAYSNVLKKHQWECSAHCHSLTCNWYARAGRASFVRSRARAPDACRASRASAPPPCASAHAANSERVDGRAYKPHAQQLGLAARRACVLAPPPAARGPPDVPRRPWRRRQRRSNAPPHLSRLSECCATR